MRTRLFILLGLVAIVAVGLIAMLQGRGGCGSLKELGTSPVAPCVLALSKQDLQEWWKLRWQARSLIERGPVAKLEVCAGFMPPLPDTPIQLCAPDMLLQLAGGGLDWSDKGFLRIRLGKDGDLINASNLTGSAFVRSDLSGLTFAYSTLYDVKFAEVNLARTTFEHCDLRDVLFRDTDVSDVRFNGSDLKGAIWNPKPGTLPNIASMASAQSLHGLRFETTPQQLSELREALYKAGLAEKAREVTFAIRSTERVNDMKSPDLLRKAAGWFSLFAFEKTVGYGMYPFRPLLLIALLIVPFSLFYLPFALRQTGWGALSLRRSDGAIGKDSPTEWRPVAQLVHGSPEARWLRSFGYAFWFAIVCAFRIGYRDVNVGDWITRLQPREFLLGATGWCRTVAGLQSLLSVYLLALTVLCIVGRPFG